MQTNYIAFKTDIIRSRYISKREDVQDFFLNIANQVNEKFANSLEAGFIVTHGDEAQCLIKSACAVSVIDIIEFLHESMHPVQLRFGIGFGTLSTKIQKMAIGMDGEAWQNAKDAIDRAHVSHQPAAFSGFNPNIQYPLESLTNLVLFLSSRWSKEQKEAIKYIREGHTQTTIAKLVGVSTAAISKRLVKAGWHEYSHGIEAIKKLLQMIIP